MFLPYGVGIDDGINGLATPEKNWFDAQHGYIIEKLCLKLMNS